MSDIQAEARAAKYFDSLKTSVTMGSHCSQVLHVTKHGVRNCHSWHTSHITRCHQIKPGLYPIGDPLLDENAVDLVFVFLALGVRFGSARSPALITFPGPGQIGNLISLRPPESRNGLAGAFGRLKAS